MIKRYLILSGLIMLIPVSMMHAQRWKEMWLQEVNQHTFHEIQAEFNQYFETHEKARGTGYNQFKRWEYYMAPRVGADGNIANPYAETWKNYREYLSTQAFDPNQRVASSNGSWSFFGSADYELGPQGYNGGNGRIGAIAFHPTNANIIYVGAPAAGLWRTNNGGATWIPLTDGIAFWGVSGIVVHPTQPNHIYILTGDGDGASTPSVGVWESLDGGNTWSPTGLNFNYSTSTTRGYKLMMDPDNSNTLYAAMSDGVYRTVDGGTNWTQIFSGIVYDMEFQPQNPQTIYISRTDQILRSTNGGGNWMVVNTVSGAERIAIAVSPANPNFIYAVAGPHTGTGSFEGVHRSINSGVTWTTQSTTPNLLGYSITGQDSRSQSWYDLCIAVSPTNINEVHVGGINMWRSNNGGQTWTNTSHWIETTAGAGNYTHADIHALEFQGNSLFVGSDGGVFRSTNQANDFTNLSKGLAITEFYRFGGTPQNSSMFVAGAQDNGTNRFEAPIPDLKMEHIFGADGMEAAIDPSNSNTFYFSTQNGGLNRTTNGGNTVTGIQPGNLGPGAWVTPFVLHPTNNNTLIAGFRDVGVSTNQGNNWTNLSNGALGTETCNQVVYAPSDPNIIYVVKPNSVWRTLNGNWINITTWLPAGEYTYIAVHPTNPYLIYLTISGYTANRKVYLSPDGGVVWYNFSGTSLPNVPVNCVAFEPGSANGVYIGTDAGVYYRDNNLNDWIDFSDGLPFLRVSELEINVAANRLRAATYGRSIWESDLYSSPCPANLTLNGSLSGPDIYVASNDITSTNNLTASADITFSGGNRVSLSPGFTMAGGAELNMIMDGCNSANNRDINEVTGTYISASKDTEESAHPGTMGYVLGNHPNPFRNHTWISFRLPIESLVSLEVVDLSGRQITVLLKDEMRNAGTHTVSFNGNELAPGIYIVRLRAGGQSLSHKIEVTR